MPLTFLSHQAAVLPLKIAAPRATSGTALVIGSMAPDVEYLLRGYPTSVISHTWTGQLTFCLPVSIVLFLIVTRLVAEPAAANAPDWGQLRLEDYALLRQQPSSVLHWGIVALSALAGSASHVLLDAADVIIGGAPYHALNASLAWVLANVGFWGVLAAITIGIMRYIGRHRLLRRGAAQRTTAGTQAARIRPAGPRCAGAFWGWVALCSAVGAAYGVRYRLPGFDLHQMATWIHIWLCTVSASFTGLVLASAMWHIARHRRVHPIGNPS